MVEIVWSDIIKTNLDIFWIKEKTKEELRKNLIKDHNNELNNLIPEIIIDKPFSDKEPFIDYKNIRYITPIDFEWSSTGEVFRIETNDWKKYKLRKCRFIRWKTWEERATYINSSIENLNDILPRYYWKQNEYLLFDWLDWLQNFWDYTWIDKRQKLGMLMAKVHNSDENLEKNDIHKEEIENRINKRISPETIQNEFNTQQNETIQERIKKWLNNPNILFWKDLWDMSADNMKFTKEGKLILIDEESIDTTIRWIWIWKIFWNKVNENLGQIEAWYTTIIKDNHIFEKEFIEFITLFKLLSNLRWKKLNHEDYKEAKNKIINFISKS